MTGLRQQLTILLAFAIAMTGPRLIAPACSGSTCPCPVAACAAGVRAPVISAAVSKPVEARACAGECCGRLPAELPDSSEGGDDRNSDEDAPTDQRSDGGDCRCLLCMVCALKAPVTADRAALMYAAPAVMRAPPGSLVDLCRRAQGIFHPPRLI